MSISTNVKLFVVAGLLVGLGIALFVSPFASSSPDGLEKVAEDKGFSDAARDHAFAEGPLADYGVKGIGDERISTGMAGVIGTLITFGVGLGLFAAVRALRPKDDRHADGTPGATRAPA